MKLVSWNVNGIRAASKGSGYQNLFQEGSDQADIIGLQVIKCTPDQLDFWLAQPPGFHALWNPAKKPGYSGVAIFTRYEPLNVIEGLGDPEIDQEGRVLTAEFKDFTFINAYFPNSQRDHARLPFKLKFCDLMAKHLQSLRNKGKNTVLCGDFNIAHNEIDLKNPKSNMNNAGFLPEERAWMGQFLNLGYIDTFRYFNKNPDHYTWWSYRPGVRERNIGWRLDYHVVNQEFEDRLLMTRHQPEVFGSDHCPVVLEIKN